MTNEQDHELIRSFIRDKKLKNYGDNLTEEDFDRAKEALEKAHVPPPYIAVQSPD
jgi:hypothetical protein